ncbi:MAG: hypothetical protein ACI4ET_12670 [Bilifractor sp.]
MSIFQRNHTGERFDMTDQQYKLFQRTLAKGGKYVNSREEGHDRYETAIFTATMPTTIKGLQSQYDDLGKRMATLANTKDSNGLMTDRTRQEYYSVKRHRDLTRERLSTMQKAVDKRRKTTESAPKKFVNGYGEATHREITSSTYERAMKRTQKDIERRMGKR